MLKFSITLVGYLYESYTYWTVFICWGIDHLSVPNLVYSWCSKQMSCLKFFYLHIVHFPSRAQAEDGTKSVGMAIASVNNLNMKNIISQIPEEEILLLAISALNQCHRLVKVMQSPVAEKLRNDLPTGIWNPRGIVVVYIEWFFRAVLSVCDFYIQGPWSTIWEPLM